MSQQDVRNAKNKTFQLQFIVASIFILTIIGWAASALTSKEAAYVGLISFIGSHIATVVAPNSKKDILRVLRFLGDIGSTVLVYSTLNSLDFNKWVVMSITFICYVLLAIRFNRDL